MPGISFVGLNLCGHTFNLNKTYSWHMLCWTKRIPGIGYFRQNYSWHMLCWTKPHMGHLVVKICTTRCFPSKKIISEFK